MTPTPRPSPLAPERLEELYEHAQRALHSRYTHPETGKNYETTLALLESHKRVVELLEEIKPCIASRRGELIDRIENWLEANR